MIFGIYKYAFNFSSSSCTKTPRLVIQPVFQARFRMALYSSWGGKKVLVTLIILCFSIQLFYFPHDVPREMGGTMVVPGSHFRRINYADIARYQNFVGQMKMEGKAGTVFALHHGIWHCGRQNKTDQVRYMFKVRLNPTVRQLRLWNTDDLEDGSSEQKIIYGGSKNSEEDIRTITNRQEPWFEAADGRLEIVNRIKLWRFLTGDDNFDAHYWLTRLENKPENLALPA